MATFHEAMTSPVINALARAVNDQLDVAVRAHDDRAREVKTEILRLEREAGNLVRFLAGGESFTVREGLQSIEAGLQALRVKNFSKFLKPGAQNTHKNNLVAPTGFDPVF